MSLTARFLEENGIPTVIIGSARDIVESCAVPRFLFTDFPLGNPIGRPFEFEMQETVVRNGLMLLESTKQAGATVKSPLSWGENQKWRDEYMQFSKQDLERLRAMGEERRRIRSESKSRLKS
ncbi:MAG: hypothetical protein OXG24_01150 [Gammaproteobacteria bacterium]|nr:hypothetical protein [Gammaproteobacteria bacterium]